MRCRSYATSSSMARRACVLGLLVRQGLAVAVTGVALAALVVGLTHAALAGTFYAAAIVTLFPPNVPTYVGVPLAVLLISAIVSPRARSPRREHRPGRVAEAGVGPAGRWSGRTDCRWRQSRIMQSTG